MDALLRLVVMVVFIDFDFGGFVVFVVWVVCFARLFLSGSGLGVLVVFGGLWWFLDVLLGLLTRCMV